MTPCECREPHRRRRVVLTGGPGAGKTAVLELIRASFCVHVKILPEAAGVIVGGGFPRAADGEALRAAQRAIFYVQRELEATADGDNPAIVLCDRGTVDGAAYWPGPDDLWSAVGTTLHDQLGRYDAIIHLRTPALDFGYNRQNPLRTESAAQAAAIDARIAQVWEGHPRRFVIEPSAAFLDKAARAVDALRGEMPECCKRHVVPVLHTRDQDQDLRKPIEASKGGAVVNGF
jgi:predicted ATPase